MRTLTASSVTRTPSPTAAKNATRPLASILRICHTRTSIGTRHASCAPSAACLSWTSSSAPNTTRSTAETATMLSSPAGAMAAARSSPATDNRRFPNSIYDQ
ncbi:unnamed protein product [Leptidea sinapis]|uniref:Uncharacterized protein n=1 Tax=Leptidea sinapis TaxID=189913 RepID=A0A5E4PUI5_9NEOP|nr:unnamed protein product [Leptidea sinapis]